MKMHCVGLFIMLGFNPFLSFLISISVGIAEGDRFAAVGMMMLLLPSFFIIGLITFRGYLLLVIQKKGRVL